MGYIFTYIIIIYKDYYVHIVDNEWYIYITTHNHIITLVIYPITSPQYIYMDNDG